MNWSSHSPTHLLFLSNRWMSWLWICCRCYLLWLNKWLNLPRDPLRVLLRHLCQTSHSRLWFLPRTHCQWNTVLRLRQSLLSIVRPCPFGYLRQWPLLLKCVMLRPRSLDPWVKSLCCRQHHSRWQVTRPVWRQIPTWCHRCCPVCRTPCRVHLQHCLQWPCQIPLVLVSNLCPGYPLSHRTSVDCFLCIFSSPVPPMYRWHIPWTSDPVIRD